MPTLVTPARQYSMAELSAMTQDALTDTWLDAMSLRFPGLMLDLVEQGIGNLGRWLSSGDKNDSFSGVANCGCLVGMTCILAFKSDGLPVRADRSAWSALSEYIHRHGNGNPAFDNEIIYRVGAYAPLVAEHHYYYAQPVAVAKEAYRKSVNGKKNPTLFHQVFFKHYIYERIVANLIGSGYLTATKGRTVLIEAFAKNGFEFEA
jgi:hypothetical protein